ncbi:hypothetical protein, partial [Desulfatiferula olefinivorans]
PWSKTSLDDIASIVAENEGEDFYQFCGIFHTLGGKADWQVPIRLNLEQHGASLNYELWIGCSDENWVNISDSKRWKSLYFIYHEEQMESWQWQYHVIGSFEKHER